jgi:Flp pilus assembly pilin Flp
MLRPRLAWQMKRGFSDMLNTSMSARNLVRMLWDERGQDSVEYAIMIGIVALAAIASVGTIANYVATVFSNYAASL